jgi:hypothetical protein
VYFLKSRRRCEKKDRGTEPHLRIPKIRKSTERRETRFNDGGIARGIDNTSRSIYLNS